jgi:hypothetical protein
MITDEKRAFKRSKRKFAVRYRPHGSGGHHAGTCFSENISLGGVYFISLDRFDIGQLLDCAIAMPGIMGEGHWTARVVRCEPVSEKMVKTYGIAVEFVESFGDSQKNLEKILGSCNTAERRTRKK